ncbi:MAG: restriction endonuclease subunit S [Prolixibacteraceae bacterium]|nr:restriction endonuclease subunit S [Prolixibacteraceae bacterium]
MSKYEKYKPSGIEWIGEVPEHWKVKHLKRYLNFYNNIRIPLSSEERADLENIYDYYGASGVIDKVDRYLFDGDYILIGEDGANLLDRNSPLAFKASGKFWVNNHAHILKPINGSIDYYIYFLENIDFTVFITGSAQPKLTIEELSGVRIVVPPTDEQLTIANFLNAETQKLDRLITNKKVQATKLKELRQIEINNAVTKGLNPDVELKDSGIDWLGKIPKHWEVKRLKNVTYINQEVINEKTSPDYELKYIDIGNVSSNGEFIELQEMTFSEAPSRARRKLRHNSIILSTVRTYLRAIAFLQNPDANIIASTGFAVIDAFENLFDAKYLFYQMTSQIVVERVIAYSEGVSYPAISSTTLGDMKIILPPKNEQEIISNHLERRTNEIDKLIKNIEEQIEKLQELRKIKIYEAVTGKIKVSA